MAGVTEAQASVMRRRRSYNFGGRATYTCPFMCPYKKKSNGVKSSTAQRLKSYAEGRRHVGTIHFGVGATVDSQQSRLLHPAQAPSTVFPLTSPLKNTGPISPSLKIPHQTLIDQRS
ncbi:hypothetical protein AVEN_4548-1 [Araneus ventricosus]|uniref:Uncharacterized protein n=1 Tax=Araneus ventricosus TaxID=182803 RepID=A0A4Y2BMB5_ARAVE|nr:hypothetical protein AVEN_4548-1 [Araneus ventricosus]